MSLQIKMWKELEDQRQREELDPAKEAGSAVFELEGSDPRVQRLQALGAQVRARMCSSSYFVPPNPHFGGVAAVSSWLSSLWTVWRFSKLCIYERSWACRSSLTCLVRARFVRPLDAQVRAKLGQAGQMSTSEDAPRVGLAGDVREVKDNAAAATDGRVLEHCKT